MTIDAQLLHLIHEANLVYRSKATWEFKYDRIFSHWSNKIRPFMNDHGMSLDWYDPDTSYEEDVRAFMEALLEFSKNLEAVEDSRSNYDRLYAEHAAKRRQAYLDEIEERRNWQEANPDLDYYEEVKGEMKGDWR